jgi:hypothetical protein
LKYNAEKFFKYCTKSNYLRTSILLINLSKDRYGEENKTIKMREYQYTFYILKR